MAAVQTHLEWLVELGLLVNAAKAFPHFFDAESVQSECRTLIAVLRGENAKAIILADAEAAGGDEYKAVVEAAWNVLTLQTPPNEQENDPSAVVLAFLEHPTTGAPEAVRPETACDYHAELLQYLGSGYDEHDQALDEDGAEGLPWVVALTGTPACPLKTVLMDAAVTSPAAPSSA